MTDAPILPGRAGAPIAGRRPLPSPVRRRRARIEIVPLIDVMFFLLAAFMMVSLSMERSRTVALDLPAASHSEDDFSPDALTLGIEASGILHVGSDPVELADLPARLAAIQRDRRILVSADRRATHAVIAPVLDQLRRGGFHRISFVTTVAPVRPPSAASPDVAPPSP